MKKWLSNLLTIILVIVFTISLVNLMGNNISFIRKLGVSLIGIISDRNGPVFWMVVVMLVLAICIEGMKWYLRNTNSNNES